jgi:hypothetical protein
MRIAKTPGHFVVMCLLSTLVACGGGGGSPTAPPAPTPTPPPPPDATIGPAGGTVTAFGGAVSLVIPANALAAATGITIRATNQVPLDPHWVQGTAYEVAPAGLAFATPATLTLRYDPALGPSGVAESDLRVHALDGAGAWQALAQTTTAAGEAQGRIAAGGIHGVRWTGPRSACSSSQDHQFDFWIGSWNYRQGSATGATNEIAKAGNGCLIEEDYHDPNGVHGRSVSLFSRLDGRWHQTYIDSQGSRIVLTGGLDGRRMLLERTASERWIWDPLDASTIHFFAESTPDGGQTWRSVFDGEYTRR